MEKMQSEKSGTEMLATWFTHLYRRKKRSGKWTRLLPQLMIPRFIRRKLQDFNVLPNDVHSKTVFDVDTASCTISYDGRILASVLFEEGETEG